MELKCKLYNLSFDSFQQKANHVRWNHKDNTNFCKNVSIAKKLKCYIMKIIRKKTPGSYVMLPVGWLFGMLLQLPLH